MRRVPRPGMTIRSDPGLRRGDSGRHRTKEIAMGHCHSHDPSRQKVPQLPGHCTTCNKFVNGLLGRRQTRLHIIRRMKVAAAQAGPKLLLVDDDARLRKSLTRYLAGEGLQVDAVPGSEQMDRALL